LSALEAAGGVALLVTGAGALALSSSVVARRAGWTGLTRTLAAWILACAQVVATVEALSLAHAVRPAALVVVHVLVAIAACAATGWRPSRPRWPDTKSFAAGVRGLPAPVRVLAATSAVTVALVLLVTLAVPANNHDGLAYHLPRAAVYLQQGSLDAFPAADLRQTVFPANAEILALWLMALLGHDGAVGLVQFLAWLGCGAAVWALARRLGASPAAATLGALAFGALPEVILQASSVQNDLVQAFFLACAFLFACEGLSEDGPAWGVLWSGLAAGLALGTKSVALLALPGLGLFVLACAERARWPWRRVAALASSVVVGTLLLGSYVSLQNLMRYGHPSGPPSFRHLVGAQSVDGRIIWANLVRTVLRLQDPSGAVPPVGSVSQAPIQAFQAASGAVMRVLGVPKRILDHDFMTAGWMEDRQVTVHEDTASFGPVFGLLALPLLSYGTLRGDPRLRALCVAAWSYLFLLAALVRWQWYHSRLLVTTALLAAAALAPLVPLGRRGRALLWPIVALLALGQVASTSYNERKALVGPLRFHGRDRIARMTLGDQRVEAIARVLDRVPAAGRRVGVVTEYPFSIVQPTFGPRLERQVQLLRLESAGDARSLPPLDFLLLFGRTHAYFRERDLGPGPWPWFGQTDLAPLLADLRRPESGWVPIVDQDGAFHLFARRP
jgi:hypothetical protein